MPNSICLGIETSCDETALALVSCEGNGQRGRFLAQTLASQAELHAIFGGVVPELASREHLRHIGALFDELMRRSGLVARDIAAIGVARGPGLLGSLLVGMAFAKGLSLSLDVPIIGVNHLHAHLLAVGLEGEIPFPALGLVISGGHTDLYLMETASRIIRLGRALDDAAGETFDKVGAAVGLRYPAGRAIDDLAARAGKPLEPLPRPYLHNDNLNFSFSGLKTAAVQMARKYGLVADTFPIGRVPANEDVTPKDALAEFCLALNEAVADTLVVKVSRALEEYPHVTALCAAGGVAANNHIRRKLSELMGRRGGCFLAPPARYCTDNAAMIAYATSLYVQSGLGHDLSLEAVPRGRPMPTDWVERLDKSPERNVCD